LTRLTTPDIFSISENLEKYDQKLENQTGRSLLGIACHACGVNETDILKKLKSFTVHVIPVTSGKGIISDFSETVTAILTFLGINAVTSSETDTSGIVYAFETETDAIMMADDNRFVGINLKTREVADNTILTGSVFAAALDLLAGSIHDRDVLVMGCGPVGESAARSLLTFGAKITLYDTNPLNAKRLNAKLSDYPDVTVETKLHRALSTCRCVLEATPSENSIPDDCLTDSIYMTAPGVPLGITESGYRKLGGHLIHDKLELGVAAMAVSMLSS